MIHNNVMHFISVYCHPPFPENHLIVIFVTILFDETIFVVFMGNLL